MPFTLDHKKLTKTGSMACAVARYSFLAFQQLPLCLKWSIQRIWQAKMETCPFITVAGLIPVLDLFCLSAFNAQALTIQENHIHNGHGLSTMEHGYDFSDGCCTCGYDGWWFNWCCVNAVITRNYIREDNQIGGCCKSLRFVNIFMEDILPTWCCYACTTCQVFVVTFTKF